MQDGAAPFRPLSSSPSVSIVDSSMGRSGLDSRSSVNARLAMRGASSNSTHATVLLPGRAQRNSSGLPQENSSRDVPPVPPPRPEHSISARTRDLPVPLPAPLLDRVVIPTQPFSSTPSVVSSPPPVVTLTAPRPGMERAQNLYVDAPLKQQLMSPQATIGLSAKRSSPLGGGTGPSSRAGAVRQSQIVNSKSNNNNNSNSSVIPSSALLKDLPLPTKKGGGGPSSLKRSTSSKKGAVGLNASLSDFPSLSSGSSRLTDSSLSGAVNPNSDLDPADSIICRTCGLCRCEACRTPRRLPEKWLCGNKCHLSADTLVDTVTCMWVVKALMYHCAKDRVEESDEKAVGYDNPCSCKPGWLGRWSCLGLSSVFLPCLCCYLPLKGCQKGVEVIHERVTSNACKCQQAAPSVITNAPLSSSPEVSVAATLFPPSSPGGDSEKSLLG